MVQDHGAEESIALGLHTTSPPRDHKQRWTVIVIVVVAVVVLMECPTGEKIVVEGGSEGQVP